MGSLIRGFNQHNRYCISNKIPPINVFNQVSFIISCKRKSTPSLTIFLTTHLNCQLHTTHFVFSAEQGKGTMPDVMYHTVKFNNLFKIDGGSADRVNKKNVFTYTPNREYRVVGNRYSRLLITSGDPLWDNLRVQEHSMHMASQCQCVAFARRHVLTVVTSQWYVRKKVFCDNDERSDPWLF